MSSSRGKTRAIWRKAKVTNDPEWKASEEDEEDVSTCRVQICMRGVKSMKR